MYCQCNIKHDGYLCYSARAGQQVDLLQEQARVAIIQRDEALRRLSAAEDEVRHHTAGLRNLQTVLEQFQRGKNQRHNWCKL